jgi:UDP-N-acetylglucosamine 2-epimerase (non-hydrolysing)
LYGRPRKHRQFEAALQSQPAPLHAKQNAGLRAERRTRANPLPGAPGILRFHHLEKQAYCAVSDSDTVQEECCVFRVPNVTIRDVTKRPETVECGSNILAGAEPGVIRRAVKTVLYLDRDWNPPSKYGSRRSPPQ